MRMFICHSDLNEMKATSLKFFTECITHEGFRVRGENSEQSFTEMLAVPAYNIIPCLLASQPKHPPRVTSTSCPYPPESSR